MIYLFNDVKELTGTVRNNHILNLLYEREKNGIYSVSAEIPVTYNDQGTIYNYNKKIQKSDFLGHYDKEGRFQLHKIAAVDIENGSIYVKGIHIFFDEAKAGAIIQDRRFVSREIIDGARVAFESIGWSVADFDVSVGKTYNFYNVTPLEARAILEETFGFEFDYWLDFDGKKVTNRHIAVKEKLGEKTSKRYSYGHNVLNIRAEQDYSEIYTAVIGRGKGEEIEETGGYGRRIEYTDIVWTTPSNPLNKPAGTRVLEDPNATQLFGYKENGVVKPRVKVKVFSEIESPTELIQASYEWLMDNNVPKAVFSLKVADGDGLNLGDEVFVIYRDIDLIKSARVSKVIDDLVSGNRDVEFGDTAYFDTDRRLSGLRSDLKRYSGEAGDRIYLLKQEYNRRFDEEIQSWKDAYDQALIDAYAQIEADKEEMTNLIDGTRTEWTENFNASVAEAERLRDENYNAMSDYVNTTVDTTRTNLETSINTSIADAKTYAEQQATEKSNTVKSDLESITDGHQGMLDSLQDNVMNIDTFLGPKDRTLDDILNTQRIELEEKIEVYNRNFPNLVIGSTLENIDGFEPWSDTQFELRTSESLNYIRTYAESSRLTWAYYYPDTVYLEQGKTYTLAFDFRSDVIKDLDYTFFMGPYSNVPLDTALLRGFMADGEWHRYYITFNWIDTTRQGRFLIGTNRDLGDTSTGWFDTRQVHVYEGDTHNIPWSPSPSDNAQVVSQLLFEMRQLEDGMNSLATRTDLDLLTGSVTQLTNEFTTTSEQVSSKLQNFDDALGVNGSHFTQIAEQVQSKVWLNDVADINPNLIPFSNVGDKDSTLYWKPPSFINVDSRWVDEFGEYVVRSTTSGSLLGVQSETFDVFTGEEYTFSMTGRTSTNWNSSPSFGYTYLVDVNGTNQFLGNANEQQVIDGSRRRSTWKFVANFTGKARILIGTYRLNADIDARFSFKEPKLERGTIRTSFLNAFSNIEQLANSIALQVQELDGEYLSQSDLQLTPNYWQLGSMRIGAENVSSVLRGSPDALDAVVSNFNLTGNLNAKGQISSLAVDAIEGNFARLFANNLTADVIKGTHIDSKTITADNIVVDDVLVGLLVARSVFADDVTSKVGNFIDLNAGNIVTAGLSANVITADHLAVGTQMVEKLFATSARIDQLISKTHFVNEMHALTLNVVDLNASHIRSRLLTANVIEAEWLKGGTALLDKVFATTGMFERMMAKTGFITTLSTVTLDLHELTIWRPDGVAMIQNGLARYGTPVPIVRYLDDGIETDDKTYWTNLRTPQRVGIAYGEHAGRWYNLSVGMGLRWDSEYATQYCKVRIEPADAFTASVANATEVEVTARRNETLQWQSINVPLLRPTYRALTFYIQIYRRGDNVYAPVEMRYGRSWVSDDSWAS